jgi:hypothetical protein
MKTSGFAVVALFGGLVLPGAGASSHSATTTVALKGTIKGTGVRQMSPPDTGAKYIWSGAGSVTPLGTVRGKGTNRGVGFIRQGNPSGTMTLTGAHGSVTLTITYDQTAGFAPLPAHGTYTITGGTGRYAGAQGSGSIIRHQGNCLGQAATGQCPTGAAYTVTYQLKPGTATGTTK